MTGVRTDGRLGSNNDISSRLSQLCYCVSSRSDHSVLVRRESAVKCAGVRRPVEMFRLQQLPGRSCGLSRCSEIREIQSLDKDLLFTCQLLLWLTTPRGMFSAANLQGESVVSSCRGQEALLFQIWRHRIHLNIDNAIQTTTEPLSELQIGKLATANVSCHPASRTKFSSCPTGFHTG